MGHLSYISELNFGNFFKLLSGNIPVFNTWLINRVSGLIITGAITFNNFDDISSYLQLFFVGRLFILFLTISSSIFLKVKVEFICLFKIITVILVTIILNIFCNVLTDI